MPAVRQNHPGSASAEINAGEKWLLILETHLVALPSSPIDIRFS